MTLPLQRGITYGPVRSRRLGRSLGINLLPLRPGAVQVYTLDRPAPDRRLEALGRAELGAIAACLQERGIPARAY